MAAKANFKYANENLMAIWEYCAIAVNLERQRGTSRNIQATKVSQKDIFFSDRWEINVLLWSIKIMLNTFRSKM